MPDAERRSVVIGIGNPERGDDAVGRLVARRLHGTLPAEIAIREADGEATNVLAHLEGADTAILIDACVCGAPAGRIRRFDVSAAPLPEAKFGASTSTHGFGLGEAMELARALRTLPRRTILYAIEGSVFEIGAPISAPVAASIDEACMRIRGESALTEVLP